MELALFMSVLHIVQQHYEEALAVWPSCLELLLQYMRKNRNALQRPAALQRILLKVKDQL